MSTDTGTSAGSLRAFAEAYAVHRAAEGRQLSDEQLLSLPYLRRGALARQWSVRARSYSLFVRRVLIPRERRSSAPLRIVDLGAGNGWLCYRTALRGHTPVAVDIRTDTIDGLGASRGFDAALGSSFPRVAASFDNIPLTPHVFDLVIFNASLHYATDLAATLAEAARLLAKGGAVVVIDSPFYSRAEAGERMVAQKHSGGAKTFGERSSLLLSLPAVEFLTRERLEHASTRAHLEWRRHRVRYPLWYELRPLVRALRREREPSRFDVWEANVA